MLNQKTDKKQTIKSSKLNDSENNQDFYERSLFQTTQKDL